MSTIQVRSFDHTIGCTQLRVVAITHAEPVSGITLVFLHDALGSIRQWRDFPELVAKNTGLNAIVYERQGHGYSAPLEKERERDYQHYEAQVALPQLLQNLKVERPLLIGHSDGGTIALLYAAAFQPAGLIAMAPHVIVEEATLQGIRQTMEDKDELIQKLSFYHGKKAEKLLHAWADTWTSPAFRDWNILDELPKIQCPVLVLQGDRDEFGSKAQLELIQSHVKGPCEYRLLAQTGHIPHLEQPVIVMNHITRFIKQELNQPDHANQDQLPFRNQ